MVFAGASSARCRTVVALSWGNCSVHLVGMQLRKTGGRSSVANGDSCSGSGVCEGDDRRLPAGEGGIGCTRGVANAYQRKHMVMAFSCFVRGAR